MEMKIKEFIQKIGVFRLLLLILSGVMLVVLSLPTKDSASEPMESYESGSSGESDTVFGAMEKYIKRQEEATEEILSKVEGIGTVEVMLTLAASEEKVTLQDSRITEDDSRQEDGTGGSKVDSAYQTEEESVLIKKDGEESPYVVQIHSPVIEGVVVVAQGVNSSKKETEIIEAIQALFPIEPHKIKVMKME